MIRNLWRPLTGHANRSGSFLVWNKEGAGFCRRKAGFAPILVTAAVSVLALLMVAGWETNRTLQEKDKETHFVAERSSGSQKAPLFITNSGGTDAGSAAYFGSYLNTRALSEDGAAAQAGPRDLSQLGVNVANQIVETYVALKQAGEYTPEQGEEATRAIASSFQAQISYPRLGEKDLKTDDDTSYERMLAYRSDMQTALQPLLENKEPEIEIFGLYAETHDKSYLTKLGEVSARYKQAVENMKRVVVLKDAVSYHSAVANSLLHFSAALDQMIKYADDPIASLALVSTYNDAERDVLTSFNALARYQKMKII